MSEDVLLLSHDYLYALDYQSIDLCLTRLNDFIRICKGPRGEGRVCTALLAYTYEKVCGYIASSGLLSLYHRFEMTPKDHASSILL